MEDRGHAHIPQSEQEPPSDLVAPLALWPRSLSAFLGHWAPSACHARSPRCRCRRGRPSIAPPGPRNRIPGYVSRGPPICGRPFDSLKKASTEFPPHHKPPTWPRVGTERRALQRPFLVVEKANQSRVQSPTNHQDLHVVSLVCCQTSSLKFTQTLKGWLYRFISEPMAMLDPS